jgi:hypothetical protein
MKINHLATLIENIGGSELTSGWLHSSQCIHMEVAKRQHYERFFGDVSGYINDVADQNRN